MNKKNKRYKACIMGASFETGNMGVSALVDSLIGIILRIKKAPIIKILIGNKSPKLIQYDSGNGIISIQLINYRLSPKAKVREHLIILFGIALVYRAFPLKSWKNKLIQCFPFLDALCQADFIGNIHGGDSFSDIYGIKRFLIEVLPDILCILLDKKLVLLPQTYGPYKSAMSCRIAKYILKKAHMVAARDQYSLKVVKSLIDEPKEIDKAYSCPDVAFSLDKLEPPCVDVYPSINFKEKSTIGLNVNGLMYYGGYDRRNMFNLKCDYKKFCLGIIKKILEVTKEHMILISHTYGTKGNVNSDNEASNEIMQELMKISNGRLHVLKGDYNQRELKGIISQTTFFIGSRMHACIAAMSSSIPTVGIAYSRKFIGVFESIGSSNMVLDGRTLDEKQMINKIMTIYFNVKKKQYREEGKIDDVKERIYSTFKNLMSEVA